MKDTLIQIIITALIISIIVIIGFLILGFMGKPFEQCENKSADFVIEFQGENYTCAEILAINTSINMPDNEIFKTLT